MSESRDSWTAGSAYEDFMGRWSRRLAPRFAAWLDLPARMHWLDVGCGTGALTNAICADADPFSVVGCDPAEPFIAHARAHFQDARASFVVAGVGQLPRRVDGYGSITSLLALNFFPEPAAAVAEMRDLAAPRATISACVWDYAGKMELLRTFWDAVIAMDPAARALDEGERFPSCRPDALVEIFRAAGLDEVGCDAIEIPMELAGFDDYWRPFLGGTGPAPSYVASLDAERRTRLARTLEQVLTPGPGESIHLSARAWAVRGLTPTGSR